MGALGHGLGGSHSADDVGLLYVEAVPRRVEALKGKRVVYVSASSHTAAVTDVGELYTWGFGYDAQLGHGEVINEDSAMGEVRLPKLVRALAHQKVVIACAGQSHTIILTATGEIYTCGRGKNGKLGHGNEVDVWIPRLMKWK